MSKRDAFFVNVFPTNDRQEHLSVERTLEATLTEVREAGFRHTLFAVGAKRLDPWVLAQVALAREPLVSPLVAVNPSHQHPLVIAKRLSSLSQLYPQGLAVNLVAGSFFRETRALGDGQTHEQRTQALRDFYQSLRALLASTGPTHLTNDTYVLEGYEMRPPHAGPPVKYFVSGALPVDEREALDTYFVKSLKPLEETLPAEKGQQGFALGICARATRDEARRAALEVYPDDRVGQRLFEFARANDQTPWNRWVKSYLAEGHENALFDLRPMQNFWSPSPFVVGSYAEVAAALKAYYDRGYDFFVVDFKTSDLPHVKQALAHFRGLI